MRNNFNTLQKLNDYGADVVKSIDRFVADTDLYIDCINMFLQDENFVLLKKNLLCENIVGAFECAHALKGVSANLGLIPMYDSICKIVEPLRNNQKENYMEIYRLIIKEKKKLLCIMR